MYTILNKSIINNNQKIKPILYLIFVNRFTIMAYTIGEFSDNHIPFNYFQYANNTHELVIDVKGQIIKLQPINTITDPNSSDHHIVFTRSGLQFRHYRIDCSESDKVISIYHEDSVVLRFCYTSYFHINRKEYQDIQQ